MGKFIDMTGKIYGFFTVISHHSEKINDKMVYFCECICRCGNKRTVESSKLRNGKTKSCGCIQSSHVKREQIFSKNYTIKDNGCWEWKGFRDKNGYGELGRAIKGIERKAHRFSYAKFKGKIPKDLCVCHSCDNPGCVNPDHLFVGTNKENHQDKVEKSRHVKGEECHKSKLNEEQVKSILSLYKSGRYTQRQLASIYTVNQYAIWAIVNRKSWKHIQI